MWRIFLRRKITDLETAIQRLGAENVGAFIAEPVLASGGVIIPPKGYHKRCLEVCRQHDVLYISDEVVTAFGRLGHWFASKEVFDIEPDIITCAKGLTFGYVPMGPASFPSASSAKSPGSIPKVRRSPTATLIRGIRSVQPPSRISKSLKMKACWSTFVKSHPIFSNASGS